MTRRAASALAPLAALLAGAAGMGLETNLISASGLAFGYGRSAALGLSSWVVGWALGAALARRFHGALAAHLFRTGVALLVAAPLGMLLVLQSGSHSSSGLVAALLAVLALGLPALAQGLFLPLLLRGRQIESAAALIASNLIGCALGAAFLVRSSRMQSAAVCGALALAAGIVAVFARRGEQIEPIRAHSVGRRAALTIAIVCAWTLGLEWIGLRLCVLWLGGMQPALGATLTAAVLALALGAALLPPLVPRGERGVLVLALLAGLASAWPSVAGACAQSWFSRPSEGLPFSELTHALVIVGPALLPLGAFPAIVHRTLVGDAGERLGALYMHEAWGAALGLPLLHAWLVPELGLRGTASVLAALALVPIALYARAARGLALAGALVAITASTFVALRPPPALASPPLANPALTLRHFDEDRDFAVSVVDDGIVGERTLLTDGFRAAGTGDAYRYMRVLGHLPLLLHPAPRTVAVLALGTGTTVGAVATHPEVERIDVLELSRAVVACAPFFEEKNHGALEHDARVQVRLGDGRRTLAASPGTYDVLSMEPLLPDSPFAVYLYTGEFYAIARRALKPGGLVCQWVPPHALEPQSFRAVVNAFGAAFPWTSLWLFGTQVILVGGEREPEILAARWPRAGEPLERELAELGLATRAGLLARYVARAQALPESGAALLSDGDPWIVFLARRHGSVLLGDLANNLAWLRAQESPPLGGGAADTELAGVRALHRAREAFAWEEAELRGVCVPSSVQRPKLDTELARARVLVPGDPELALFVRELEFVRALRQGVSSLAADRSPAAARAALEPLTRAASACRERGDVHLYVALALERIDSPAAPKALDAALERCPRIALTPVGLRVRELGLSDASWERLCESARRSVLDLR